MFQAEVDKTKNLLKISYAQHVGPEDTKRGEEELPVLLADLRPGFRLLTDLSALESMDLACGPYINDLDRWAGRYKAWRGGATRPVGGPEAGLPAAHGLERP